MVLTRKKCGQQEVPKVLDLSRLQQNVGATSTQTLSAISSFSKPEIKKVSDQPGLKDQVSVMQDFSLKTFLSPPSSVNQEAVSTNQIEVKNKPFIEKQSSTAIEKSVNVEVPPTDVMKQVPKRGRKPGTKNKPKIEDLTWDDYEFNSGDEGNAVAMTYEEKAELYEDLLRLPALSVTKLLEIVRSRDSEQIDEDSESLGVNFETLQPITMHEIKAFADFYLNTSNVNWSVSTVRPKINKPPQEQDQTLPLPKKSKIFESETSPPLKVKKPASVNSKNVEIVPLEAKLTFKPPEVVKQTDLPSKKGRAFLSSTLNVLDDKLRAMDSNNHSNAHEMKLLPSQNSGIEENMTKSDVAIKPTKTKITSLPSYSNGRKVASEGTFAATLKDGPLDEEVNRLRRKEKERRRRESMANPSFTEQIELMDWMEAQM